jgi:hypothetical protein
MLSFFALLTGIIVLAGWMVLLKDWRRSASWTRQSASVKAVHIEEATQSIPERLKFNVEGYKVRVVYIYKIGPQRYVGQRFSATQEPFFETRNEAEAFAERFPIDGIFPILVDMENPENAVVQRKLETADLIPGIAGLALVLLGALGLN